MVLQFKRYSRLFLAPLIIHSCLCSMLLLSIPAVADTPSKTAIPNNKDEKARLNALKKSILSIESKRKKSESKKSATEKKLRSLEKDISKTIKKIRANQKKVTELKNRLKKLNANLDDLEQAKSHQKYTIAKTIRSAYKVGDYNTLQLLMNQDDPDEVSRMLHYYDYLNEAHSKKLAEYKNTIQKISEIKPKIENTQKKRLAEKEALAVRHKKLTSLQHSRKNLLKKVNASINNQTAKLKKLNADRKNLEDVIKQIEEAIAAIKMPTSYSDFPKKKKNMPWPVQGRLQNRFGSWRQPGSLKWDGIFIKAKEGTKVSPIHHGQVIFADWLRGHGLLIILDHGGGYLSLYAHNQTLLKSTGDWVDIQDTIATAGKTGGLPEPGLYFEVRQNSRPVDPLKWCCRR